jgi:transposase
MDIVFTPGAGLDGHKKSVTACRITPDPSGQQADGIMERTEVGTRPIDLLALSDWLAEAGITPVALESTGEYWKPVVNLLEGSCEVCLVNAAHVQQGPGRKTDKADARWLAKLRRYGLLKASFIPPQGQRELRDLTRYRLKVVQERSREINRVQGVLERANIKLAAVASDIMGGSGRAILAALIEGRAEPATMAELARGRRRSTLALLEQALTGLVRDHHRRLLALQLAPIDFLDEQIEPLNATIMEYVVELSPGDPPGPRGQPAVATDPPGGAAPPTAPMTCARAVILLDPSPGVDQPGAEQWVAEMGIEMARFGTAACLAAWRGVAPGNDESAGKQRSRQTRHGNRVLPAGLTQLAHAAARTKGTSLSALDQPLAARRGKKRAIVAVAHAMVVSAFHMLSRNEPYQELGPHYCDERRRHHLVDRLARRLQRVGYQVHLELLPTPTA